MSTSIKIGAYGEGILYPPKLKTHTSTIQNAGWDTILIGLFHLSTTGEIGFNNAQIISKADGYFGDANWASQLTDLLTGGEVKTLIASFGGGGVGDFNNIKNIYKNNNKSFSGTNLESNFKTFKKTFPMIDIIDMDCEDEYNQDSFVAFCQLLITIGFEVTFCPYALNEIDFWTGSLASLEKSNPGKVLRWNLQCYDGGGLNNPKKWAKAIKKAIPSFNTDGFIWAGDWSRNYNKNRAQWVGNCPPAMQTHLAGFKGEPSIGGAFLWTIDQIEAYAHEQTINPDPNPCGTITQIEYVQAIKNAFS